jgi:hypothetical protein
MPLSSFLSFSFFSPLLLVLQPVPRFEDGFTRHFKVQAAFVGAHFNASQAEQALAGGDVAALIFVDFGDLGWADSLAHATFCAFLLDFLQAHSGNPFEWREPVK